MYDRYINPATDFGFKRLFGTEAHKDLLIDFLNRLLPQHHHIHTLTYRHTEQTGLNEYDRRAIFDVACESETGEKFIVEFQRVRQAYFKDRTIFYATFPLQEQAQRGDWDYQLQPVYMVSIVDFLLHTPAAHPRIVTQVVLKDDDNRVFYDKLTFIYVELPKFTKKLDELETDFERWLYLLRHLAELDAPPPGFESEPLRHLFEAAELAKMNRSERMGYESHLKTYRDWRNAAQTLVNEAVEEAVEEEKQEMARRMKADGLSFEVISRYTGLSAEEILALS